LWILAAFLRALSWIGVRIDLLVIVREGETPIDVSNSPDDYDYGFVSAKDIKELYRLDPENDRQKLAKWFQERKLCFGIRDDGRLIAKKWCDFDEFYHPTHPYKLAADEVYLYLSLCRSRLSRSRSCTQNAGRRLRGTPEAGTQQDL
jgi:hypothetical protein